MPQEDFYVCLIPGLTINVHLYIRNDDIGCVCFMHSVCKQIHFYWYEKVITIPTINVTRLKFQCFGEEAASHVSSGHKNIIWRDSDVIYL